MTRLQPGACGVVRAAIDRPSIAAARGPAFALRSRVFVAMAAFGLAPPTFAQSVPGDVVVIDPIIVTATRTRRARRSTCPRRSTRSTARRSTTASRRSTCPRRCVRVAGRVRGKSAELRAGPADQLARIRRARRVRRARRAPVPGRHPGDDARRAGADRQLQPAVRASASKCCAGRSRRFTATRRAA